MGAYNVSVENPKKARYAVDLIDTCRSALYWLISLYFSPLYGINPVLLLDWRRFKRTLVRNFKLFIPTLGVLYLLIPVCLGYIIVNYNSKPAVIIIGQPEIPGILIVVLALASLVFIFHILTISTLNLINPLGKFYGELLVYDMTCIPGGHKTFFAARLLPRASVAFVTFVAVFFFVESGFKAMDVTIISIRQYYILIVFSAILSYLHFIGIGLLVQMYFRALWLRSLIVVLLVLIAVITFKPEWMLSAIDEFAKTKLEIPAVSYLLLWGLHPFGSSEAISRFFTDAMSPMAKYFQPWTAFWIRSGVQFVVVVLIWTIAFRKFHIRWSNTASYPSRSFHL